MNIQAIAQQLEEHYQAANMAADAGNHDVATGHWNVAHTLQALLTLAQDQSYANGHRVIEVEDRRLAI